MTRSQPDIHQTASSLTNHTLSLATLSVTARRLLHISTESFQYCTQKGPHATGKAGGDNVPACGTTVSMTKHQQQQSDCDEHERWMCTSKEGNGAGQETSETDVQTAVHQAGGQAIGDAVLHQGALDHIQDRHSVHLHTHHIVQGTVCALYVQRTRHLLNGCVDLKVDGCLCKMAWFDTTWVWRGLTLHKCGLSL